MSKMALHGALVAATGAAALLLSPQVLAQALNFAQSPLFLGTTVKPNVLVVYDNSQSMDGTMAGKLIAGSDPTTLDPTTTEAMPFVIKPDDGPFSTSSPSSPSG